MHPSWSHAHLVDELPSTHPSPPPVVPQVMVLALIFAFVVVIASTFVSIPLLLHGLGEDA